MALMSNDVLQDMPIDLSTKKRKVESHEDNDYNKDRISEMSPIDLSLSPRKHKRKSSEPRKLTDFSVRRFFSDSPGSPPESIDSRDAIVSHSAITDLSINFHGNISTKVESNTTPLVVDTRRSTDQCPVSMTTRYKPIHGNSNYSNHLLVIPTTIPKRDKPTRRDSAGSAGSSVESFSDDRLPSLSTSHSSRLLIPPTVLPGMPGGMPYFPYPGYYPYPVAPSLMPILYPNLWKMPLTSRGPYPSQVANNPDSRNSERDTLSDQKNQSKSARPTSDKNNNDCRRSVPGVTHAGTHVDICEQLSDDEESGDIDDYNGGQRKNYKNMTRERRVEANARERTRVHTISAAFEDLRRAVPSYYHNQKLSKLAILRIACCYIMALARLLGEDYSKDGNGMSFEECMELCNQTILADNKARKRH